MFPGIIGMSVLFSAIFGAMSIVWDREFGFLKEVLVAPIDRSAVAIGKTLGGATQAMIQGLILLVLAPLVGVKLTVLSVVELLPLVFVLAFALSVDGRRARLAHALDAGLPGRHELPDDADVLPLGRALPPVGLPEWLAVLTRINPASYGMDPIRRIVLAPTLPPGSSDAFGLTIMGQVVPMWSSRRSCWSGSDW